MRKTILILLVLLLSCTQMYSQWIQTKGPYGGIVSSILATGDNVFVGTYGGVFYSNTRGESWVEVNTGLTNQYVNALAQSGTNLFAGTNLGIFRSTNNGASWTTVNSGLANTYVNTMTVSGTSIYAGTNDGVYISNNNGAAWTFVNSVFSKLMINAIAVSGTTIFVGTNGNGVYRSTNNGTDWTTVNTGLTNRNINDLSINGSYIFAATGGGGIYIAGINGNSWTAVNNGINNFYVNVLFSSGSKIYAGAGEMFLSTDFGTSWTAVASGINSNPLAIAGSGTTIYDGTDNGIFVSTDNGVTWADKNQGLISTTIYSTAVSGTNIYAGTAGGGVFLSSNNVPDWNSVKGGIYNQYVSALAVSGINIYAGTDNGIYLSTNNGNSWSEVNAYLNKTRITALAASGTNIFAGTRGMIYSSTDKGATWTLVNVGLNSAYVRSIIIVNTNVFAGTNGGVFLSTNNGTSWTAVNNGITYNDVRALAQNGTNIFAGTQGDVYLSTNNGASWTAVDAGLNYPYVFALAVSGTSVFAGTHAGVFHSTNNGKSWIPINAGLKFPKVNTLSVSPTDIIAGTDGRGVWQCSLLSIVVPLSITAPNGGEVWLAGTTKVITWTSTGVTTVKLEYTTDSGTNWTTIQDRVPAPPGSFNWTVPIAPSSMCKIRITDVDNADQVDLSDAVFTIASINTPIITVTSPNGGEVLKVGDQKAITWTSSNVGNVNIECLFSGTRISVNKTSIPAATGSYYWIVKNYPSTSCKIKISDASNNAVYDESDNVFEINYPREISLNINKSFDDAKEAGSYRIIGLPGVTDIPVSTTLNGTYPDKWKAGWDNGASSNYMVGYDGTERFNFKAGRAFWILSVNPFQVTKSVNTVTLTEEGTYKIPLHQSWNLISNPFEKNISWAEVQQLNGIPAGDLIYDFNSMYFTTSTFVPYKGYYFFNRNNLTEIELPYVPQVSQVSNSSSMSKQTGIKEIKLSAFEGSLEKSSVKIKILAGSSEGVDDNDIFYPPGDFEPVGLRLRNEKLSTSYKYLKEECRPGIGEGQEYSVVLKNTQDKPLSINCTYSNMEEEICLLDEHGSIINLKENKSVLISSSSKERVYKLLVGTKEYTTKKQLQTAPKEYGLLQNYPNPFNPLTTIAYTIPEKSQVMISIFNTLGERVSELVNEEKEAGFYQVTYRAAEQSSGIYFYRLNAGVYTEVRKMVLEK